MSRTVSGDPLEPCTVEKRTNTGVVFSGCVKKSALVYSLKSSYTWNSPCAPNPRACTTRSGIRSWSKCIIFSRKWKSSSKVGPLSPTVSEFSSSLTFIPLFVVIAVPSLFFLRASNCCCFLFSFD